MSEEIHLTKIGKTKIEKELEHLIKVEREDLKILISEARALGDLKENAEYHAAKEKQSHIEGRIAELQGIVAKAIVIDVAQVKSEVIVFGPNGVMVKARTANQRRMVGSINNNDVLFAIGPAGTGKT